MKRKYFYVMAAVILWGLTYLLLGDLLKRFPPSELLVIRFSGSLALTALVLLIPKFRGQTSKSSAIPEQPMISKLYLVMLALLAGLYLGFASTTQKYGIQLLGKPVHAAFLTAIVALFVPLIQKSRKALLPKSRDVGFVWQDIRIPLILSISGTALLCELGMPGVGDLLVILSAFFYALQADLVGAFKKSWAPAYTQLFGCVSCVLLGMLIAVMFDKALWVYPVSTWDYFGLGLLIVGSSFFPWFLIHWSAQNEGVDPYIIGILYTLEPVITLFVGWPLGIETFSTVKLVGCVLILWAAERTCRL